MTSKAIESLAHAVNAQARSNYPGLAKKLGMKSVASSRFPRIALRLKTPYPYKFVRGDSFYPTNGPGFGRVIEASRDEGIQEIHASISQKDKEHGWLFIPRTSQWIDTTFGATDTDVVDDQYVHIFLSHLFPSLEKVHTHPDKVVRALAGQSPRSYSSNYLAEAARPSNLDFVNYNMTNARTAVGSRLVSSVVSHYGVTSFESNDTRGEYGGFCIDAGDWLIKDRGEPIQAILASLRKVESSVSLHSGKPAISITFEPLAA